MVNSNPQKSTTIFLVDEEQWLMEGVVDYLSYSYNVMTAHNVDQALAMILENKQQIDVILLDIMMPQGDIVKDAKSGRTSGLELARILIEEHKITIPIICYTVINDRGIIDQLLNVGVREVVSKRRLPSELEKVIVK